MDPLHRDHENRPHDTPAEMDEDEKSPDPECTPPAIYTRWIDEFNLLHPGDNKLDLPGQQITNLVNLMWYVLEWTHADQVQTLGDLAVMLAEHHCTDLLFLWRALGLQQSFFAARLEKHMFHGHAPLYASISSLSSVGDEEEQDMDKLVRRLGVVPRAFLGRTHIDHTLIRRRDDPNWGSSSCEDQRVYTFDQADANGRMWPLVGCFGDGDHCWIYDVRCADTGIVIGGVSGGVDQPPEFVAHEAFFAHPIAREFALSDEERERVIPEEQWPPQDDESISHLPCPLSNIESYEFWKPRTLQLITDNPLARQRLAVLQSKWIQIRDLYLYSRYSPRLWRGEGEERGEGSGDSSSSQPLGTLKQLQKQLETINVCCKEHQNTTLKKLRKVLYSSLLEHTNLPEVLAHLVASFV